MSYSSPRTIVLNTSFPVLEKEPRALCLSGSTLLLSYVPSSSPIKKTYFIFNYALCVGGEVGK